MKSIFNFVVLISSFSLLLISCKKEESYSQFKKISSSHSGITFNNKVVANDSLNAFNFTNFYNGGGIGVGDFNNDGLQDVVFTSNQDDPTVYLNLGGMKFKDISETAGLWNDGWVTGVSIVDINNDGWNDIYISQASHGNLSNSKNKLYINQKTESPTFTEEAEKYGLAYEGFTMQTVFFDYDLDGDLDAYMLNTDPDHENPNYLRPRIKNGSHPSTDKLFENQGRNEEGIYVYKDVSDERGILYEGLGLGVSVADFNNDGYPDIYASNDFLSDDILYIYDGKGKFDNAIKNSTQHTSMFGMGIDAADLNNDQRIDILQLDMLPEDNERQKQMIARDDYAKKQLSVSPKYDHHHQYMRNMLQLNMGSDEGLPQFSEQGLMFDVACTDWSWSVLLADLDLDGMKDMFICNGYRKNVTDLDFVNFNRKQNIFGTKEAQQKLREEYMKQIPEIKLKNYAFKGVAGSPFLNVSESWGLDELSFSNGSVYADLDNDGDLDLLVNNIDDVAFFYENKASDVHYLKVQFKGSKDNIQGIGSKVLCFSGGMTQKLEYFPVRGYQSSMGQELVFGLGQNSVIDSLQVIWPDRSLQTIINPAVDTTLVLEYGKTTDTYVNTLDQDPVNLFSDLKIPISYLHQESDYVDFFETKTLAKKLTRMGPCIEKGDFNGDGKMDFVLGGAFQGTPTQVYLQKNPDSFEKAASLPEVHFEVGDILVFDHNGDGFDDIILIPGVSDRPFTVKELYQPVYLESDGKGGFTEKSILPEISICSKKAILKDFDGDGDLDIFVASHHQAGQFPLFVPHVYLENNGGKFVSSKPKWLNELDKIGLVNDLLEADINGDGINELLIAADWQEVMYLDGSKGDYVLKSLNIPKGWWKCIKAADIDNDGDLDLILGNEGLNSLVKASPAEPVAMMVKDFNGDGKIDPIMAIYLKGKRVPLHPLGTLTEQIIQFKYKYIYFSDYAKVGFDELFTSNDLVDADIYTATELRSMIAINDGKGNFTLQELPIEAQVSPTSSIQVSDFNHDGILDILMVGNFYPNESVVGAQDGSFGQLLLGQSNGRFRPTDNKKTGLWVTGDARELLYLEKENLILCTINDGPLKAMHIAMNEI